MRTSSKDHHIHTLCTGRDTEDPTGIASCSAQTLLYPHALPRVLGVPAVFPPHELVTVQEQRRDLLE